MYFDRYQRQDMAKAVIDRPVRATWQGRILIEESTDDQETQLEKVWDTLGNDLKLKSVFIRLDKLTGIGRYGVLLFGLSDVKTIEDFAKPTSKGAKLMYLKPYSEDSAKIATWVTDPNDKRYGMPLTYTITVAGGDGTNEQTLEVHYSRVLHVVEDNLESEIYGTERLKAVFNRLWDLEKLVGGDAEMFWRGARPGYSGTVGENFQMTDTMIDAMQDQIDEFEHNLRRILINEGVELKALAQQIADPSSHVDVQIQMISAVTGI
jgi:hypothetical protein